MTEAKFWCITSGKGGVGKTSLAVNLAFALARRGKRILLVDGDLGLANVDVLLGLEVGATIREILDQGVDPRQSVIMVHPGLGVLPASSGVPEMATLGPMDQEMLGEVLQLVAAPFDLAVVDTAAGVGPSVLWFNTLAWLSLVLVTPDPTAITDAYALIKILAQHHDHRRFGILINNVQGEREARQTFATLNQAATRFLGVPLKYLGMVPADPAVSQALRMQKPFVLNFPESPASQAVSRLADRLLALEDLSPFLAEPVGPRPALPEG